MMDSADSAVLREMLNDTEAEARVWRSWAKELLGVANVSDDELRQRISSSVRGAEEEFACIENSLHAAGFPEEKDPAEAINEIQERLKRALGVKAIYKRTVFEYEQAFGKWWFEVTGKDTISADFGECLRELNELGRQGKLNFG